MEETIRDKDMIVMKLLHYFITEKNYNPIVLQGAQNEIWLENMQGDYKIVRIVSNHIHNDEQLSYDFNKTKHIVKKIERKTLSFGINVLSIYTDIGDSVSEDNLNTEKKIDCMKIYDEKDLNNYKFIDKTFPDIKKKLKFSEEGMQLFFKITADINKKNQKDQEKAENIFKKKTPYVTYILIAINVLIYLIMLITNNGSEFVYRFGNYAPFVIKNNEFYRLITSIFLHSPSDIFHIIFNCYALYVLGSQLESFMGKSKYLAIYLYSGITGSLLSMLINGSNAVSIGASGAIFGIMGGLLYFGYHYRVYLGGVIKSQIIPLIIINLIIGFTSQSIDNFAHIGGLIGGALITSAVGVKYKSSKSDKINGIITSILFVAIMIFLAMKFVA